LKTKEEEKNEMENGPKIQFGLLKDIFDLHVLFIKGRLLL